MTEGDGVVTKLVVTQESARLEEDILWTEKVHFAAAERLERRHYLLGGLATLAATASAASLLQEQQIITGVLALGAASLSALLTLTNPLEASTRHLASARALGALRVELRQTAAAAGWSQVGLMVSWRRLREVARQKASIDSDAPGTRTRDFAMARKKIDSGHFDHSVD